MNYFRLLCSIGVLMAAILTTVFTSGCSGDTKKPGSTAAPTIKNPDTSK
jgi:hypothetical protein